VTRPALVLAVGAVAVALGTTGCASEARGGTEQGAPRPDSAELARLWAAGVGFPEFVEDARRRRATWRANRERAELPGGLLGRVDAAGGPWKLLAVAEDWCGDSAHNVPYLAELAGRASNVELRIVGSREGAAVTAAHRTPDGRSATPTVVLLDDGFRDRGCLVERPPALQEWVLSARDSFPRAELHEKVIAWYEEDRGRATLAEMVSVIEAAARGHRRCPGDDAEGQ
jgi:hypothetical protein